MNRPMRMLRFIDVISELEGKIFSFLILIATIQICYELTLRYFFAHPTIWGLELSLYLCGAAYVFSGAYAERLDSHITLDIVYKRLNSRMKFLIDILKFLFFLVFLVGVVWQSLQWFWEAVKEGATSGTMWDIPIWPMRLLMFLGSLLLLLEGISKRINGLIMRSESSQSPESTII